MSDGAAFWIENDLALFDTLKKDPRTAIDFSALGGRAEQLFAMRDKLG